MAAALCTAALLCLFVPMLQPGLWLLLACFAALLVFEASKLPSPAKLGIERQLPSRVGLGQVFERVLSIEARVGQGLCLEVHEEFPQAFEVLDAQGALLEPPPVEQGVLPREGRLRFTRQLCSRRRGSFALGDLRVALSGPLGLLRRTAELPGEQHLAVVPPLEGLSHSLALLASERWFDLGVRRIKRRGGRTEFESLRDYAQGDDPRLIDWKAAARRGRLTVRQYEEERGQELLVLIDCGRRMRVRSAGELSTRSGWTKLDWALDAALELCAVALSRGERVGALAHDSTLRAWVAPARGRAQLERLRQALDELEARPVETDLARALAELGTRHRRRAVVVVLSDAADPLSVAAQMRALASASRRHRLIFAALDDPEVTCAARLGAKVDPLIAAAALEQQHERAAALAVLRKSGARVLDALPSELAGPLLASWLAERG